MTNIKQLNSPLKLISTVPDALSYRINLIEGQDDSPERLFLSLLPTNESRLTLEMNQPAFDENPPERVDLNDDFLYECPDEDYVKLSEKIELEDLPIRQQLLGYRFVETPNESM